MNNSHPSSPVEPGSRDLRQSGSSSALADPGYTFLRELKTAILATVVLGIVVSGIYPLFVWGLGQSLFHSQANGSLIVAKDGQVLGSSLLGQNFNGPQYFNPRPSAAGAAGYDATASSGTNLGPTSEKLINGQHKKDEAGERCCGPGQFRWGQGSRRRLSHGEWTEGNRRRPGGRGDQVRQRA